MSSGPAPARPPASDLLGPVRAAQRELTRQRLVRAARIVFERDGYGDASIGEIAAAAAVNRATFYLHFDSKAEVFSAVADEVLERETIPCWRTLDSALAEGTFESVRGWLDEAVTWWDEHAAYTAAANQAAIADRDLGARWQATLDKLANELTVYLARFPAAGRADARLTVELLVLQLDRVTLRFTRGALGTDRGHLLDLLAGLWIRALT